MRTTISFILLTTFTVLGVVIGYTASKVEAENTNSIISNLQEEYQRKIILLDEKNSECRDYLVMIREKGMDLYWKNLKN